MKTTIEWTWRRLPATVGLWNRVTKRHRDLGVRLEEYPLGVGDEIHYPGFTFNPWRGCEEVPDSPACDECYAKKLSRRNPKTLGVWGHHGYRALATESYWKLPHQWNQVAAELGVELNVFCLSLGDWLEDHPALVEPRARLLRTIQQTPWLRWLLLTKRPENWRRLFSEASQHAAFAGNWDLSTWLACWVNRTIVPPNVRIGITAENQFQLEQRAPHLLKIPAPGYFISAEPLLGPLALDRTALASAAGLRGRVRIITGGESGAGEKTRPSHPYWFESLQGQGADLGFEFFFKQWGDWAPRCGGLFGTTDWAAQDPGSTRWTCVRMTEGGFNSRTGEPLVPGAVEVEDGEDIYLQRVGKANAGRTFRGREWNGDLAVTNGMGM